MTNEILFYTGAAIAAIAAYLAIAPRILRRHYKFPVPSFVASFLDSRFRRMMQPPNKIVERSGIKLVMKVMELGCGPGTYTLDIARAVGDRGEVYAVDIQKAMIDKLEKKLQKPENRDVRNVIPKVANAYELPLPEDCLDTVIVICALQEIPDRQRALGEVHRVLRPHGVLAVSEWAVDPDYPLRRTTKRICEQAGFRLKESGGNLFHYTLQFEKQSE